MLAHLKTFGHRSHAGLRWFERTAIRVPPDPIYQAQPSAREPIKTSYFNEARISFRLCRQQYNGMSSLTYLSIAIHRKVIKIQTTDIDDHNVESNDSEFDEFDQESSKSHKILSKSRAAKWTDGHMKIECWGDWRKLWNTCFFKFRSSVCGIIVRLRTSKICL